MPVYNKLIRDLIPEIILKNKGISKDRIKTRILRVKDYRLELIKKLVEESKEVLGARDNKKELIKEIGDVKEIIEAIEKAYKLDKREISALKRKRRNSRGGFEKRIFLERVLK